MFGGGAEAGNAPIQAMMGKARPGYNGDQGGTSSCGGRRESKEGELESEGEGE